MSTSFPSAAASTAPATRARRLALCLDGTSNKYAKANTNVVKLCGMLEKSSPNQLVYYEPGIGTMVPPGVFGRPARWLYTRVDLAFGISLGSEVQRAYGFLMDHYRDGDRIYLFGFSRGAYTARALAGMLYKVGLLEPGNEELIPFAWSMYLRGHGDDDKDLVDGFRHTFCHRPFIHMLGLWDTVSSVRWALKDVVLDFTASNPLVQIVRHAVAIDERRAYFRQNLWAEGSTPGQDVEQLWFAGCHCDVGGGYPEPEAGLSKVALKWMIATATKAGLTFNPAALEYELPMKVWPDSAPANALAQQHESLRGPWWIVEVIPKRFKDPKNNWKPAWAIPLGARRSIDTNATVHASVVERIQGGHYHPENLPPGLPSKP
jgi:uncharacterized protein (DUF2235 family)